MDTSRSRRIALIPLLAVSVAVSARAQRVPDLRVDHAPRGAVVRTDALAIAASGGGVYVVWADRRGGTRDDIWFNRSLDGGATWLPADVRLDTDAPGAAQSFEPAIAASGTNVFVVWRDDRNGADDIFFNRSFDAGATWLEKDVRLDSDVPAPGQSFEPRLVANGLSVSVVWCDARVPLDWEIYFDRSLDGGTTWLPAEVPLGSLAGNARSPALLGSGSALYTAWIEDIAGPVDTVASNRSLDGGASWLGSIKVNQGTLALQNSSDPSLAFGNGALEIVWWTQSGIDSDVYASRSTDNGLSWSPSPVRIDHAPAGVRSEHPVLAAAGASVYVAWEDYRNGFADVYLNRSGDGGVTWSPVDVRLDTDAPGAATSRGPQIVADGATVYVFWEDLRNGNPGIWFNRSLDGGASWLPADRRADTGKAAGSSESTTPRLAMDGPLLYATWRDARLLVAGGANIWCNIPFGALPYGAGNAGTGGFVPHLAVHGAPTLGNTFSIDVTQCVGGALSFLGIGGPGSPVTLPLLGGTLLVYPAALWAPVLLGGTAGNPGGGSVSLPVTLRPEPSFVGVPVYLQALVLDAGAPLGVAFSNALELWFG